MQKDERGEAVDGGTGSDGAGCCGKPSPRPLWAGLPWAWETQEGTQHRLGSLEARQSLSHVGERARTRAKGSKNQGREHRLGEGNNSRETGQTGRSLLGGVRTQRK